MTTSAPHTGRARGAARLRRVGPPAAVLVPAALVAALSVPADAGDQTLTGSVSQTFIGDTNTQLESDGDSSLGSITRLSLKYENATPTATLSLNSGINYSAFTAQTDNNIDGLFPQLSGSYRLQRPTRSAVFNFSASLKPTNSRANRALDLGLPDEPVDPDDEEPVDPADPDAPDDGVVEDEDDDSDTLRLTLTGGFSYSERLTSTSTASFGITASRIDFEDEGANNTPSTSFAANSGFSQQLNSKASWGINARSSLFLAENQQERRTLTFSATPNFRYAETPDIVWSASLGPSVSITHRYERTPTGLDGGIEVSPGVVGSAGFRQEDEVERTFVSLSQSVVPDDRGVAVNRTGLDASYRRNLGGGDTLSARTGASYRTALSGDDSSGFNSTLSIFSSAGYSREINTRSNANLNASLRYLDDRQGADTTLGLGASYSYRLTDRTRANVGYDFRIQRGDSDATSHRVSLTLSRGFTLLP